MVETLNTEELNVYQAADGTWFVLIVTPDKLQSVAKAIGRPDLLADPRFSDPAKLGVITAAFVGIALEATTPKPHKPARQVSDKLRKRLDGVGQRLATVSPNLNAPTKQSAPAPYVSLDLARHNVE